MKEFRIGTLIRNKNPYFGEATKLIINKDETQYYIIEGPNKYGYFDYPNHREIIPIHNIKYYKKATFRETLFLTVWKWISKYIKKGEN